MTYPEVCQFEVVVSARHEQIGWLEISVDDALLMDNVEGKANLNEELPGSLHTQFNQPIALTSLLFSSLTGRLVPLTFIIIDHSCTSCSDSHSF